MKKELDYSKLLSIYGSETDNGDTEDIYEIVNILSEGKSKAININKNFQLLDVSTDLKKFTTNYKNIIEYFPTNH